MRIESNFYIKNYRINNNNKYTSTPNNQALPNVKPNYIRYNYPAIYFCGGINPKNVENIFNNGKNSILCIIDKILKQDVKKSELTPEEFLMKTLSSFSSFIRRKYEKKMTLILEAEELLQNKFLNSQQKINEKNRILRELRKLEKMQFTMPKLQKEKKVESPFDFILINKFKTALQDKNLNFEKIYFEHFSDLRKIKNVKELEKLYPKIHVPKRPEDVAAQKIEFSFTRDFYESLIGLIKENKKDEAKEFIRQKISTTLETLFKDSSEQEKAQMFKKLSKPMFAAILRRVKNVNNSGSFNSISQFRKQKQILSDTDRVLLGVDYNDFVLTVIREQYLNKQAPNNIVYSKNGVNIKISSLKEKDYCFEKIPREYFDLISKAENLKKSLRDYDIYTIEDFKEKLNFYSDRFGENDELFDMLSDFDGCKYTPEDILMLKKFLGEIDKVWDGDQTLKQALTNIKKNSYIPRGTNKIKEEERLKNLEAIKLKQKNFAKLKNIQDRFDESINILYKNNLAYIAEICSDFRPKSLDDNEIEAANHIIDLITKNIDSELGRLNKEKAQTEISRWYKYNEYTTKEPESKVLESAKKYGTDKKGNIDTNKVGKYLINAEALETYPQSIDLARNKEIFKRIVENSGSDKDSVIRNLCKFDEYLDLNKKQKTYIKEILKIFNIKNDFDKDILKYIIENDYINVETKNWAKMDEYGSKKVFATIGINAKQELIDKYKFPQCIEFFEAFEDALSQFATTRGSAGIKKLGKNNKNLDNVYELKIMGHDDRLIAYDGYYFDKFAQFGLH